MSNPTKPCILQDLSQSDNEQQQDVEKSIMRREEANMLRISLENKDDMIKTLNKMIEKQVKVIEGMKSEIQESRTEGIRSMHEMQTSNINKILTIQEELKQKQQQIQQLKQQKTQTQNQNVKLSHKLKQLTQQFNQITQEKSQLMRNNTRLNQQVNKEYQKQLTNEGQSYVKEKEKLVQNIEELQQKVAELESNWNNEIKQKKVADEVWKTEREQNTMRHKLLLQEMCQIKREHNEMVKQILELKNQNRRLKEQLQKQSPEKNRGCLASKVEEQVEQLKQEIEILVNDLKSEMAKYKKLKQQNRALQSQKISDELVYKEKIKNLQIKVIMFEESKEITIKSVLQESSPSSDEFTNERKVLQQSNQKLQQQKRELERQIDLMLDEKIEQETILKYENGNLRQKINKAEENLNKMIVQKQALSKEIEELGNEKRAWRKKCAQNNSKPVSLSVKNINELINFFFAGLKNENSKLAALSLINQNLQQIQV